MYESFLRPKQLSGRMFGVAVAAFLLFAGMLSSNAMTTATSINITLIKPIIAEATPPAHGQNEAENIKQRWRLGGLMAILLAIAVWYLRSHKGSSDAEKQPPQNQSSQ